MLTAVVDVWRFRDNSEEEKPTTMEVAKAEPVPILQEPTRWQQLREKVTLRSVLVALVQIVFWWFS